MSSEIIAVLVGIVGVLIGAVTGLGSKNKSLKKDNKELSETNKAQEKITDIMIEHNKQENTRTDNFKSKQNGTIKKLIVLFCFGYMFSACSYYNPTAPKLYIIDKPQDFTDIDYIYQGDMYCFDEAGMKELLRQIDWSYNTISTYEKQIKAYNNFLDNVKE